MSNPDFLEETTTPSTPDALPETEMGEISPADTEILERAKSFLESLTGAEDIVDITKHASAVGEVMAWYDLQEQKVPSKIDTVYLKLTVLQCQFHIKAVTTELQQPSPDKTKMQHALTLALDVAKIIRNGYKDDSLLQEVQELQRKIDLL